VSHTHACKDQLAIATELQAEIEEEEEVKETDGTEISNSISVRSTVKPSPARRSRVARSPFCSTSAQRPLHCTGLPDKETDGTKISLSLHVHCNGLPNKQLVIGDDAFSARYFKKRINEIHGWIPGDDIILGGFNFTAIGITSVPRPATKLRRGSDDADDEYSRFRPPHVLSESPDLSKCTSTHTELV
jgi:hypothetical protein